MTWTVYRLISFFHPRRRGKNGSLNVITHTHSEMWTWNMFITFVQQCRQQRFSVVTFTIFDPPSRLVASVYVKVDVRSPCETWLQTRNNNIIYWNDVQIGINTCLCGVICRFVRHAFGYMCVVRQKNRHGYQETTERFTSCSYYFRYYYIFFTVKST